MQLSTAEAVRLGFVLDRDTNRLEHERYISASSFDLSIRDVLIKNAKTGKVESHFDRSVVLSPQDSAYLISEEIICIPQGYIAYVFLKNRQSQRGLLALNTGIIDQGYYGAISTLVTNLSSEDVVIPDTSEGGKLFFRVVFHRISDMKTDPESSLYPEQCRDYEEYRRYRELDLRKFPRTFLDVEAVEKKISARITKELSAFSYMKLGTTIAIVGILLSLLPLAKDYYFAQKFELSEYIERSEATKLSLSELSELMKALDAENDSLKEMVTSLKTDLALITYQLEHQKNTLQKDEVTPSSAPSLSQVQK